MLAQLTKVLPFLWANWLTIGGTILTTLAANAFVIFLIVDWVDGLKGRYAAAVGYLFLPVLFVVGLLLVGLGLLRARRRQRHHAARDTIAIAVDTVLKDPIARRRVVIVLSLTAFNVVLVSVATYEGVHYMHGTAFCGELCHSVMGPELSAYRRSPHARVPCVDCHVGAGAGANLKSKLSGARQLWGVATGNYARPIHTPVQSLRPAQETCEKCHWPAQFHGERLIVRHHYQQDEKNTRQTNVVQLNVGGRNERTGRYEGIHWHVSPGVKVTYEALDAKRTRIGKVVVEERGKPRREFDPPPAKRAKAGRPSTAAPAQPRLMDCVDCHNRPTHIFDTSPAFAVDRALAFGKIDRTLPFINQQAVALLTSGSPPRDGAARRFAATLRAFYGARHPQIAKTKAAAIDKAARELAWIYRRNIFPEMKLTWNSYPDHIGHKTTTEGCFRCHDDEHKTKAGKVLSQDCDICHDVLAEDEERPDVPPSLLRLGQMR